METAQRNYKNTISKWLVVCTIAIVCSSCNNSIIREGTGAASSGKECRVDEAASGTKIKKSICMTTEEWAVVDARNAEIAKEQERLSADALRRIRTQSGLSQGSGMDNPNTPSP